MQNLILIRARVTTRTYARVKILKCSKSLSEPRRARTRSFWAFQKFPSVRVRARVMRARNAHGKSKFRFFTFFWFLIQYSTIFIYLQLFLTFHKAVHARQSSKSARAAMGNIMQIWSKTWHFAKRYSCKTSPLTPTFYIMVRKSMSWKFNCIPPWPQRNVGMLSNWQLNSKKAFLSDDVTFVYV